MFETHYEVKKTNVLHIRPYLENFMIYLIFESLDVECFLTLTKVNSAIWVINHLREYGLDMPMIALLGSFTTQILGVSLELRVLYSMSNGNQANKA